ncbi:MAG: ribonuclease Y [Desulfotalea sp.]
MFFSEHPYIFLGIDLIAGIILGFVLRKIVYENQEKNIRKQGKQIIENAIIEAEQFKKAELLQSKEEVYQAKQELEEECKLEKEELREEQRQIKKKRDHFKRDSEKFEKQKSRYSSAENALEKREKELEHKVADVDAELADKRAQAEKKLAANKIELENELLKQRDELTRIAGITQEEAKKLLMASIEGEAKLDAAKRLSKIENELKMDADRKARSIISLAICRYAGDYVADKTVSMVPLPSDEMKGRIIGREGRNIRAIEAATGIDIIIDDTPEAVILSGFNPVRREVARQSLLQLIGDGRIHPGRIEEIVEKVTKELDSSMREAGEQATFDVGAHGVHVELINLLGRLRYRTSYGQNVLQHSLEVAFLCGIMAAELGLDVKLAKRAGLLHDIGKAVDHEVEGSHAVIGRDLARKYGESDEIVYAIGAHHADQPPQSVLDVLVQAADALSGARPGARKEMLQSYVKRLEDLESIANEQPGVEKSYAIQAGRDLRIVVDSKKLNDSEATLLSRNVAEKIEEKLTYPGQIKVTVIRETRSIEYAR